MQPTFTNCLNELRTLMLWAVASVRAVNGGASTTDQARILAAAHRLGGVNLPYPCNEADAARIVGWSLTEISREGPANVGDGPIITRGSATRSTHRRVYVG